MKTSRGKIEADQCTISPRRKFMPHSEPIIEVLTVFRPLFTLRRGGISSLNVRILVVYFVEGGNCYAISGIDNIRGTNRGKKL
jgi:hypothetical protein